MTIELVNRSRLLITLPLADMELLGISFDQLSWSDFHSQKVIKELILLAENQTGFATNGHKMLIEALPEDGGCLLWITLLPEKGGNGRKKFRIKGKSGPYVYQFASAEQLLSALSRLKTFGNRFICPSSLVSCETGYRLLLYPHGTLSPSVDAVLSEYGRLKGRGNLAAAAAAEHGRLLAEQNAIETVSRYLN